MTRHLEPGVLIVNHWDSRCGSCGDGCSPHEVTHETAYGVTWADRPRTLFGCGARFTKIRSDYVGTHIKEWAAEHRPDLEWVGYE